ncbi:MAG TPA: prenyltransferase [Steroidobacteraceae bacterium]|nr:prenyltransferase [Steroidobacteraceae bacterium]
MNRARIEGSQLLLGAHGRSHPVLAALVRIGTLVRYRFFLYAGLMPYLLGAAWARGAEHEFHASIFWLGLSGVALAVVGVEAFNEYFDSRLGTDRVFNPADAPPMSVGVFWLGTAAFASAFAVGVYLTLLYGTAVLAFASLGGLAAIFYAAPPIRWSYRGLGELAIGLAYGPWLTLGSVYLQTRMLPRGAWWASCVPGFLIMALAVVNAIPDYHQDRLVGKRNWTVRLGRRRAVWLYLGLASAGLLVAALGVAAGEFPRSCLLALLALPLLIASGHRALATYERPRQFGPAVRSIIAGYLLAVTLFAAGLVL